MKITFYPNRKNVKFSFHSVFFFYVYGAQLFTFLISHNAYFSVCLVVVVNFPFTLFSSWLLYFFFSSFNINSNSSWKSSSHSVECLHTTDDIAIIAAIKKNELIAFTNCIFISYLMANAMASWIR